MNQHFTFHNRFSPFLISFMLIGSMISRHNRASQSTKCIKPTLQCQMSKFFFYIPNLRPSAIFCHIWAFGSNCFSFSFSIEQLYIFLMPRRSETSSSAKDDQSVPMEFIKTRRSIAGQSPKMKQSSTFSDDGTLSIQSDITSQGTEVPQKPQELKRALKARHVSTSMLRSNMDIIPEFLLELTRG